MGADAGGGKQRLGKFWNGVGGPAGLWLDLSEVDQKQKCEERREREEGAVGMAWG